MADKEIVQKTKIPFLQKEALFKLEMKSVLTDIMSLSTCLPARVLNWKKDMDKDREKYAEQITKEFLETVKRK